MDKSEFVEAWAREAETFRSVVGDADLATPVPSCPDWTLRDLTAHLAQVLGGYARQAVETRQLDTASAPVGDADPAGAFDSACAALANAFDELSLDDPSWNPSPLPGTARCWFRRAAVETAIHRWDAQMTVASAGPIEAGLAVEGVDEVLDTFLPLGRRRDRVEVSGLLHLVSPESGRQWFVRWRGDRYSLLSPDGYDLDGKVPQARVTGSASDLLLALWGRVSFDALDCQGDVALVEATRTS